MTLLISFSILILFGLGVMAYHIKNAPEGYQDEQGFHYGKPPNQPYKPKIK